MRPRRGSRAVARLDGEEFSACLVAASPFTLETARFGDEMVYCISCGRLLWRERATGRRFVIICCAPILCLICLVLLGGALRAQAASGRAEASVGAYRAGAVLVGLQPRALPSCSGCCICR